MAKRIGIVGKSPLGKCLVNLLGCEFVNVTSDVKKSIAGFDVLINAGHDYDVVWCEDNPIVSYDVMVFGLDDLLKHFTGKFIHISSDAFYDGFNGPYSEDEHNVFLPLNRYAQIKYFQEMIVQKSDVDYLIIRTSDLYGDTENIKKLKERIEKNHPISGATEYYWTPTYIPHLAVAVKELLQRNLGGIINIAGKDFCNEEEFNKKFCEIANYPHFYRAGISHRDTAVRQPKRLGLKTNKAEKLGISLFSLEEGIKECLL